MSARRRATLLGLIGLTLLALARCLPPSASAPTPTSVASAPASHAAEARVPVGVPQRDLRQAPMLFHPALPLVAQIEGDHCDVWDIEAGLYRGAVTRGACERWGTPARAVPAVIEKATPFAPPPAPSDPDEPLQRDQGKLVAAWSPDGKLLATGRRGMAEVRLWDAHTNAALRTLVLPVSDSPAGELPRLEDLGFLPDGTLCAAALPLGAVLWNPAHADAPPKPLPSETHYQSLSLDKTGRYLGGSGTIPWPKSIGRVAEVLALTDGASKLSWRSSDADEAIRTGTSTRGIWAPGSRVVYAVEARPILTEACEDHQLTVTALDLAKGASLPLWSERAELRAATPSPDGRSLLLTAIDLGACEEQTPARHASRSPVTTLWSLDRPTRASWSLPVEVSAALWAPGSDALALVIAGQVEVHSPSQTEPLARWRGGAPIAFSPDGERVGSTDAGAFTIRSRSGKDLSPPLASDILVAAWSPADEIALASKSEVSFWDGKTRARRGTIALGEVAAAEWSMTGKELYLATGAGRVYVVRPESLSSPPTPLRDVLGYRQIAWAPDGALVVLEEKRVRRFIEKGGEWLLARATVLAAGESVDRSGSFALLQEHTVRRLDDGEVLHVDRNGLSTDRYAFTTAPPSTWVFRRGPDVLTGELLRAREATFLEPTPDLGARFLSGAPLPGLRAVPMP